jgi:hypothetical protein
MLHDAAACLVLTLCTFDSEHMGHVFNGSGLRFRFTVQVYDVPIVIVTIGSGLRFRFTVPVYDVPIVIVTIGSG